LKGELSTLYGFVRGREPASPEEIAARRGLPLEDVAPAALLRARAGVSA
jgi:hypothetical protein